MQFKEKKNIWECIVGAKSCAQGAEKLEEKPDAKWNQGTHTQDNAAPRIILHLRNRNSYAAKEKQLVKAYANVEGQVLSPAVSEWNLASGVTWF